MEGVCPGVGLPKGGVSAQGGCVCPRGCVFRGCLPRGVSAPLYAGIHPPEQNGTQTCKQSRATGGIVFGC